jgi:hypothetical protein
LRRVSGTGMGCGRSLEATLISDVGQAVDASTLTPGLLATIEAGTEVRFDAFRLHTAEPSGSNGDCAREAPLSQMSCPRAVACAYG